MNFIADNRSTRFVFSNDLKSLTIRDVCRDCVDNDSQTGLSLIQCNASNIQGEALASGYLTVIGKSRLCAYLLNTSVESLHKELSTIV